MNLLDAREHFGVREWGTYRVPLAVRLLRKVSEDGDCWAWTGTQDRNGYGSVSDRHSRKMLLVHRVAYELFTGPIPPGMEIDHKCRNRCCINPDHLREATPVDNCANRGGRFAA